MFEANALVKLLLVIVGAQVAFYVTALRPWRVRDLPRALSPGIDGTFAALVALAIVALIEPRPFDAGADWLVAQTSLPDSLATIDAELAELEQMPGAVWEEIKASFGFAEPPPVVPPAALMRPGAVESAVVEAVGEVVSIMVRASSYAGAVLSLWMLIVMRLFVRSATSRRLRDERAWLEAQAALDAGGGA